MKILFVPAVNNLGEGNMQEQTGRIEKITEIEMNAKPSMRGKWIELHPDDAKALAGMNRHERRKWLARQRRAGRTFKAIEVK